MTKWPVQKPTHRTQKHVEHQNATDIKKKTHYILCISYFVYPLRYFKFMIMYKKNSLLFIALLL